MQIFLRLEKIFTVFSLLIFSGGFLDLILSGGANENEFVEFDSSLNRILYFLIYIISFFLIILRWKKVFKALKNNKFIWILLALGLVSWLWSFERSTTLKNSITLVGSTLFGTYFGTRYTVKEQVQLIGWMFAIASIFSLLFAIGLPKYGRMGGVHEGKWRGIFVHKNGLGAKMVTSSIIFSILNISEKKFRWLFSFFLALSVLLLILARSSSALSNFIMLLFAFLILPTFRWKYEIMIPSIFAIATVGATLGIGITENLDAVFGSMGKDASLTGRTDLWPAVLEMIWKHPWLGYGYGGFWHGLDGESAYIWRATNWTPTHPHNGYLALWLDLGLLGLSIFAIGFFKTLASSLAGLRLTTTAENIWPIMHLTYMMLVNLTETDLLQSNALVWILYVSISCSTFDIKSETPYI